MITVEDEDSGRDDSDASHPTRPAGMISQHRSRSGATGRNGGSLRREKRHRDDAPNPRSHVSQPKPCVGLDPVRGVAGVLQGCTPPNNVSKAAVTRPSITGAAAPKPATVRSPPQQVTSSIRRGAAGERGIEAVGSAETHPPGTPDIAEDRDIHGVDINDNDGGQCTTVPKEDAPSPRDEYPCRPLKKARRPIVLQPPMQGNTLNHAPQNRVKKAITIQIER